MCGIRKAAEVESPCARWSTQVIPVSGQCKCSELHNRCPSGHNSLCTLEQGHCHCIALQKKFLLLGRTSGAELLKLYLQSNNGKVLLCCTRGGITCPPRSSLLLDLALGLAAPLLCFRGRQGLLHCLPVDLCSCRTMEVAKTGLDCWGLWAFVY